MTSKDAPTFEQRGFRVLVAQLGVTLLGDAGGKAAVLAATLIATRVVDPVDFGQLIGLTAVVVVAAWVWDAGISVLLTREVAGREVSLHGVALESLRKRVITFPLWAFAFGTGAAVLAWRHALPLGVIVVFGAASLFAGLNILPLALLRGELRFRAAASTSAGGRWVAAAFSGSSFVPERGSDAAFLLLAIAALAGEIAIAAFATIAVVRRRRVIRSRDEQPIHLSLRAAFPFAANVLLVNAYNRLDVVVVAALVSSDDLAAYAAASRLQDAAYVIPISLLAVGLPLASRAWRGRDRRSATRRLVRQLSWAGLALALPVAVLIFVFAPIVIDVALGSAYDAAVTPTRILIWFLPFGALTAPLLAVLAGSGRAGDTTRVFATAFGIGIGLQFALDWRWGAEGAATASLLRDPAALAVSAVLAARAGLIGATGQPATHPAPPQP